MIDVLGLTSDEFRVAASRLVPETSGLAPRIYARIFAGGVLDAAAEGASAWNSLRWNEAFAPGLLPIVDRLDSEGNAGTTTKFVLATRDGFRIESVAIPMYGGTSTLCVSSQVGCARGCAFCETGRLGLTRDLDAGEIVSQVLSAALALGVRFRNVVFMGMGEPLDNLPNVARAIRVLRDRRGFAYSQERMTICTSGDADGIDALARLDLPRLNLSVSLNAADDGLRSELMPANRTTSLERLVEALRRYPKRRNFVLGVNYCLLPGLNDSTADADRVARFCAAVGRCLVNLIPYNPGSRPIAPAPQEPEIDRFLSLLVERGVPVRLRVEKGRSVMAACGQLGGT